MGAVSVAKISEITYTRLRKLAHSVMQNERRLVTLSPTVLLHEALLRWNRPADVSPNREYETNLLRLIMRHLVVDCARRRSRFTEKASGEPLEGQIDRGAENRVAVREAMRKLALLDQRQAAIVEMRVLGGLTMEQIGERLGCCGRTVRREWATAQLWLRRELSSRET